MIIGIVGLGLIGGSYAAAITEKTGHVVLGQDLDSKVEEEALERGWIQGKLEDRISECDILVLALYPQAAVEYMDVHGKQLNSSTVVMDTCGVKRVVTKPMRELAKRDGYVYLGSHPMAGREFSGLAYAQSTLFEGASLILTPEDDTPYWVLRKVKDLADQMGFKRVTMTSDQKHDEVIAFTSQLCHVVSNAYVKSPRAMEYSGFSAGSFQDLTRVAKLNETMWTELFLDNKDCLKTEIDLIIHNLQEYSDALAESDADKLKELLRIGREIKEKTETIY